MDSHSSDHRRKLEEFMCGLPIKKLPELFVSNQEGACIVPVWFDSVVEGVDMWFKDDQRNDRARFRMKMKVKHGDCVAVFAVFDKDVQELAIETCPLLLSMGESSSLYPDEMECYYGDGYLCKVQKRDPVDFDDLPAFNVLSVCSDVDVVNMFFDEFIQDVDNFIEHPLHDFNVHLNEAGYFYYSECGSDEPEEDDVEDGHAAILDDIKKPHESIIGPENALPPFGRHCNLRVRKDLRHGLSTSIQNFVYTSRKSCIKRKLCFDDDDDEVANKKQKLDGVPGAEDM